MLIIILLFSNFFVSLQLDGKCSAERSVSIFVVKISVCYLFITFLKLAGRKNELS